MSEFLVSCIVPTHLRPNLLRSALSSVLNQSFDQTGELIVVDDAEHSATRSTVASLSGDPSWTVRYVPNLGRGGASASRNLGANVANSDLLAFLDDDDLWRPDFLSSCLDALAHDETLDMVVTGLDILETDGKAAPLHRIPSDLDHRRVSGRNPGFTGSNFVIRREFYQRLNGFDEDLPVSNDKDFLLRFLKAGGRYRAIQTGLAVHRLHRGPRLTDSDVRRSAGMLIYLDKHQGDIACADRTFLLRRIHSILARSSPSYLQRAWHLVCSLAYLLSERLLRLFESRRK